MNILIFMIEVLPALLMLMYVSYRIKFFLTGKKVTSLDEFITHYPITGILSIIGCCFILSHNFIFLDLIDKYDIQAFPESKLYCYVEISRDNSLTIYPCQINKYKEENGYSYYLNRIYVDGKVVNMLDDDISFSSLNTIEYAAGNKYRIINLKYSQQKNMISTSGYIYKIIDLIIAILDLSYGLLVFIKLSKSAKTLDAINADFKNRFGNIRNPKTNEPINSAREYINAVDAQNEPSYSHNSNV